MALLPIRFFDETDDETFHGDAELDSETGVVSGVEHDDDSSFSSKPPFLPEGFEFRVGILDMGGKELEFALDVDVKTGKCKVDREQLQEILQKARAWVTAKNQPPKKSAR